MFFGLDLFSRKQPAQAATHHHLQLRTPSPSIDSASTANQQSPPPVLVLPEETTSTTYSPPLSPQLQPQQQVSPNTAARSLHALILSIPPKSLHAYTLAHLSPSTPLPPSALTPTNTNPPLTTALTNTTTLSALTSFFASLTPPPTLHCVRCHKSYVDVENDDRSCLVPHDDESAEVERVGLGGAGAGGGSVNANGSKNARARGAGDAGTAYETLWGCCGRTVPGDGDMGPPDGWCYEGKHTTDTKRARFRDDSTMYDDKLISCARRGCAHAATPPRRSFDVISIAGSNAKGKERARARANARGAGDVRRSVDVISNAGSSASTSTSASTSMVSATAQRKRKRNTEESDRPHHVDIDDVHTSAASPRVSKRALQAKEKKEAREKARERERAKARAVEEARGAGAGAGAGAGVDVVMSAGEGEDSLSVEEGGYDGRGEEEQGERVVKRRRTRSAGKPFSNSKMSTTKPTSRTSTKRGRAESASVSVSPVRNTRAGRSRSNASRVGTVMAGPKSPKKGVVRRVASKKRVEESAGVDGSADVVVRGRMRGVKRTRLCEVESFEVEG